MPGAWNSAGGLVRRAQLQTLGISMWRGCVVCGEAESETLGLGLDPDETEKPASEQVWTS